MNADKLRSLLRLRDAAVDEAKLAFAAAIAAEDAARDARSRLDARIAAETRAAESSATDRDVEQFALWLAGAQKSLVAAEAAVADATTLSAQRRAELALARTASAAVARAIERCVDAQALEQGRVEQRALDEAAQTRWRSPDDLRD